MIRSSGLVFLAMFPSDDSFTPVWTKKESLQGKHPPAAEYYFLCEDILYSLCIHKMKAHQSMTRGDRTMEEHRRILGNGWDDTLAKASATRQIHPSGVERVEASCKTWLAVFDAFVSMLE